MILFSMSEINFSELIFAPSSSILKLTTLSFSNLKSASFAGLLYLSSCNEIKSEREFLSYVSWVAKSKRSKCQSRQEEKAGDARYNKKIAKASRPRQKFLEIQIGESYSDKTFCFRGKIFFWRSDKL